MHPTRCARCIPRDAPDASHEMRPMHPKSAPDASQICARCIPRDVYSSPDLDIYDRTVGSACRARHDRWCGVMQAHSPRQHLNPTLRFGVHTHHLL